MMGTTTHLPKLRFPNFERDWSEIKLEDLAIYRRGSFPQPYGLKKWYNDENGTPFVQVYDVDENMRLKDSTKRKISKLAKENSVFVPKGSVLLTIQGSIGRVAITQYDAYVDRTLLIFQEFKIAVNKYFLIHSLKLLFEFERRKAPGGTIKTITKERLNKFKITIPELDEQIKIGSFYETVDKWIQNLKSQKEELEKYKKGMMQKIFSQEIRFKDDGGSDYPDWQEILLGKIAYITTGSSNRVDSTLQGDYTFFDRSMDIRASSKYLFDTEAIIVAGEGQEFYPKHFKGKFDLHQRTYAIMNFKNSSGLFLFYYITYKRKYFNKMAVGTTVPSLRLPMFNKMPVSLPTLDEQEAIAHFFASLDYLLVLKQQQIDGAERWKKGLMQKMFV